MTLSSRWQTIQWRNQHSLLNGAGTRDKKHLSNYFLVVIFMCCFHHVNHRNTMVDVENNSKKKSRLFRTTPKIIIIIIIIISRWHSETNIIIHIMKETIFVQFPLNQITYNVKPYDGLTQYVIVWNSQKKLYIKWIITRYVVIGENESTQRRDDCSFHSCHYNSTRVYYNDNKINNNFPFRKVL